jgi:hypothetical protein
MFDSKDIRNFYFENEIGQRIDCQKIDGNLFLYNVTGLGFEKETEYVQIGNTFVKNKENIKQNIIEGELEFYNMTYDEYTNFIDFVLSSKSLKLIYVPKISQRKEFYRDIDIVKIDKNEEDDYNVLISPITIYCKSLWYKQDVAIYTIKAQDDEIRWDFRWDSRFTDYDSRNLTYINKGHVEAPVLIEMSGHLVNPKIELYIEGELYQTVAFNVEIAEYEKLLYGTKENEFYINRQKTDGTIESLFSLDVIDFENDNVIRLPLNKSCEIRLKADNEVLNAQVTILAYYKAV